MINDRVPERFINDIVFPACEGDETVISAFRKVPRRLFIDSAMHRQAYEDLALPIGMGQTISQPSTVARMLFLLNVRKTDTVLEIGSGSGFLTALLSVMAKEVYSIERIGVFFERARKMIRSLNIRNALFRNGDGGKGWSEFAPFDRIVASAGATSLPEALKEQLKEGGIMVIPINGVLMKYCYENGSLKEYKDIAVSFVDFVGN